MEPSTYLAIAAMLGSLIFMALGFINQRAKDKQKCETTEFKVGYAVMTLLIMLAAGLFYSEQVNVIVNTETILQAFAMGLAGNAGFSKFISLVTNMNAARQQLDDLTVVAEGIGETITPGGIEETEQPGKVDDIIERAKAAGIIKE